MDAASISRFDILQLAIDSECDERELHVMLKHYLTESENLIAKLEQALRNNNILGWHHSAKTLREVSLNVTARKLASMCSEALMIDLLPHVQARSVLYHTQKEFALLKAEILSVL